MELFFNFILQNYARGRLASPTHAVLARVPAPYPLPGPLAQIELAAGVGVDMWIESHLSCALKHLGSS